MRSKLPRCTRHLAKRLPGARRSARIIPGPLACRSCKHYQTARTLLDLREHDIDQLHDEIDVLEKRLNGDDRD